MEPDRTLLYNSITNPAHAGRRIGCRWKCMWYCFDNGRTQLFAQQSSVSTLHNAMHVWNGCPIHVGGHTYGSFYSGPIGSVITPHYNGMKEFKHLSYASSFVESVRMFVLWIELHKLLLYNRRDSVDHISVRVVNVGYFLSWKKRCWTELCQHMEEAGWKILYWKISSENHGAIGENCRRWLQNLSMKCGGNV